MRSCIIECKSVSKFYGNKDHQVKAVDAVNLGIAKNEILLIHGRSGAGKSTLLSLMSGLEKPTTGKILLYDKDISSMQDHELSELLSHKVGIIFQDFNLLPRYTVYENIEVALEPSGMKRNRQRDIILDVLKKLQLEDKTYSPAYELSIGQQQKVAIARTLAKRPGIIFADEPTGSVDELTAGEIIQYLLLLKKEENMTMIIASHGSFPSGYADRIITMENGRLL